MASLPLSRGGAAEQARLMELALAVFFLLLALAAMAGLTADSRDSADWKPTNDGFRPT